MKTPFVLGVAMLLLTSGCLLKPEEEDETCPKPALSVAETANGGGFDYYVGNLDGRYGFYELQYGPNGFDLGSGTILSSTGQGAVNGLVNGAYDVYLRANCGGNDWSEWGGPRSVLITTGNPNACAAPSDLNTSWAQQDYRLTWHAGAGNNFYEVEYGVSGFTIGSGTRETVTSTTFPDGVFSKGTTYDFHVRASCDGNAWSEWVGPKTFYADKNANRCLKPLGVQAKRVGSYIEVTVDPDGENVHEVNFNNTNFNDSENIHTQEQNTVAYGSFSSSTEWYVWVRSVCNDGNKTDWVGPKIVY